MKKKWTKTNKQKQENGEFEYQELHLSLYDHPKIYSQIVFSPLILCANINHSIIV